jgi:hypothetical protein
MKERSLKSLLDQHVLKVIADHYLKMPVEDVHDANIEEAFPSDLG